jgi:hypothetical protein
MRPFEIPPPQMASNLICGPYERIPDRYKRWFLSMCERPIETTPEYREHMECLAHCIGPMGVG